MQFIMFSSLLNRQILYIKISYTIATTIDTLKYSHVAKTPEFNIFDICRIKKNIRRQLRNDDYMGFIVYHSIGKKDFIIQRRESA